MTTRSWVTLLFTTLSLSVLAAACGRPAEEPPAPAQEPAAQDPDRIAPLLDRIGDLHHPITTTDPMAQKFFDQGLTLMYGFNHLEAVRSFQEAARLDPECAMCYWGQALAHGPNINDPAPDAEREDQAYEAIQKALGLKEKASEAEQGLIDALAARYAPAEGRDRSSLNAAYAEAMADLHGRFPDDPEVAILRAASIMNTMPWDYWTEDGEARPGTEVIVETLEKVMKEHPGHPGAHHYYIHAVEASTDPDRAVASADRLGSLVPVAGHLVHMPSHIYIRVGRYADATEANIRAIASDEDYVTQCRAQGIYPVAYYPHNIHFLWAALTMEGRGREALEAARQVASKHEEEHLEDPTFGFPHLLRATPLFTFARFGMWEEALAEPEPPENLAFVRGIRHFARGMAFRARGDLDAAASELEGLEAIAGDPALEQLKIWEANSLARLLGIGTQILAGELAGARGETDLAVQHLTEAVRIEESLTYSEPRDWPQPPRHSLGAVLLEAGRAAEAEKVYRKDLETHRDNGWALFGLWKSLEAQGRAEEAAKAKERLDAAWARADIELTSSRL